jgi:hypothetical protein
MSMIGRVFVKARCAVPKYLDEIRVEEDMVNMDI